jgi:hypothetical protein
MGKKVSRFTGLVILTLLIFLFSGCQIPGNNKKPELTGRSKAKAG